MTNQTNQPAAVRTFIRNVPLGKDSGRTFDVPLHELLPRAVIDTALDAGDDPKARLLRELLLVGTSRIFVDVQASAKTDAERLASCEKKLDAWREGEMHVKGGGGGGETREGEVKRQLIAAYMTRTGDSEAKAGLVLKGRGYEVLRGMAASAAEATVPELDDDATDEDRAARVALVSAETERRFLKSKAQWDAKADAALAAKADARRATERFDVTSLLDMDDDEAGDDDEEPATDD